MNFNKLTIGDILYRVCDSYDLGNPEKTQVHKIVIRDIKMGKEGKNIYFNETEGYSNKSHALVIPVEKSDTDLFEYIPNEQYPNTKHITFSSPEKANGHVREYVIKKIDEIQVSIPEIVEQKNNEIKRLRSTFHEILNQSFYKEFDILN